jgi:hypothetical protein
MPRRRNRRGSALLEFALGLAVLTPAFAYGVMYLQSFYWMSELEDAVRRGAEAAMRSGDEALVRQAVLQQGVPGLRGEHVRVKWEEKRVTVSVEGYGLKAPGGEIRLAGRPRAMMPRVRR